MCIRDRWRPSAAATTAKRISSSRTTATSAPAAGSPPWPSSGGDVYKRQLPAWLITGLEQAVLWQTNEADRTLYSTLFQQDGIMSPDDILKSREPEKELRCV